MAHRIRALQLSDEAEWRRLWTDYLAFYKTTVAEPVYLSTFARLLGGDPVDFSALVVEGDEGDLGLVGLVHYLFHRTCWKIEPVCYLQDLFVAPGARGTGLGRALIEAVYARADAAGAPAVYWLTQDFNHDARLLYDRIAKLTPFIRYNRAQ